MGAQPTDLTLTQTLQNQLNGHYSPLYGLENMTAGVAVEPIEPGSSPPVDGFSVSCDKFQHGAMSVLGFRIEADGKVVTFPLGRRIPRWQTDCERTETRKETPTC